MKKNPLLEKLHAEENAYLVMGLYIGASNTPRFSKKWIIEDDIENRYKLKVISACSLVVIEIFADF
jgi:hypothetical protein